MKTTYRHISKKLKIMMIVLLGVVSTSLAGAFPETGTSLPSDRFASEANIGSFAHLRGNYSSGSLFENQTTNLDDPVLRALNPNEQLDAELGAPVSDAHIFLFIIAIAYAFIYRNKKKIFSMLKTVRYRLYNNNEFFITKYLNLYQEI